MHDTHKPMKQIHIFSLVLAALDSLRSHTRFTENTQNCTPRVFITNATQAKILLE